MIEENAHRPLKNAVKHLEKAQADLAQVEQTERAAEKEIAEAEHEIEEAIRKEEHSNEFPVVVLYDGIKKPFQVRPEEIVKRLLNQALAEFGPLPNPHTLALYIGGKELIDSQTVKEAGIKPHDVLLLRPSAVRGGA
jgi:hypothetical protein